MPPLPPPLAPSLRLQSLLKVIRTDPSPLDRSFSVVISAGVSNPLFAVSLLGENGFWFLVLKHGTVVGSVDFEPRLLAIWS